MGRTSELKDACLGITPSGVRLFRDICVADNEFLRSQVKDWLLTWEEPSQITLFPSFSPGFTFCQDKYPLPPLPSVGDENCKVDEVLLSLNTRAQGRMFFHACQLHFHGGEGIDPSTKYTDPCPVWVVLFSRQPSWILWISIMVLWSWKLKSFPEALCSSLFGPILDL